MITVLTGTNNYAISEALRVKTSAFHGTPERFDGTQLEMKNLPDIFMGASLFSSERLVVLTDMSTQKALWSDLEPWIERVPNETDIVMIEPRPDKRTKTYKALQKHAAIHEYADLSEGQLSSWLQARGRDMGAELTSDVLKYFLSYVGTDQWRLENELQKLLLTEKPITKELIQDVSEPYPEGSAFELLDSIFAGNRARAEALLALLREREDPYQFFGLLSSQAFALLAVSVSGSRRPDDVARDIGVHPFVVKKLAPIGRKLGYERVVRLIEQLAHADERIKTGAEPWQQLEITLLSI